MKTIKNFFDKAHILLVYPVMVALTSIMFFAMFLVLGNALGGSFPLIINIKVSLMIGPIMGLAATSLVWLGRKSDEFWRMAEEVSKKVDAAETKLELTRIQDNEFAELRRKSGGGAHYTELMRLGTIIRTKKQYVK